MSRTREEFQAFLESLKGDRNVYFQPPSTVRMNYPAIKYSLNAIRNTNADNLSYLQGTAYMLTYITYDPDDEMIKTISQLPMCKLDQHYSSDNLNHYVYTIYY